MKIALSNRYGSGFATVVGTEMAVKVGEILSLGNKRQLTLKQCKALDIVDYAGKDLRVQEIPKGKKYYILNYDDRESIITEDDLSVAT